MRNIYSAIKRINTFEKNGKVTRGDIGNIYDFEMGWVPVVRCRQSSTHFLDFGTSRGALLTLMSVEVKGWESIVRIANARPNFVALGQEAMYDVVSNEA